MQGLSVSKFADRDSQEVQGYLETLRNVFDNYKNLFSNYQIINFLILSINSSSVNFLTFTYLQ